MSSAIDLVLTGQQKAVVLLLSMGDEAAADVLRHLDDRHVRQLSEALDTMRSVSQNQLEGVLREYERSCDQFAVAVRTGSIRIRRIASRVLGQEKADDLLAGEIRAPEPLRLLNRIEPETLAGLLSKEHVQSLAALLAHVDVEKAAAVISHLPEDSRVEIVKRMASLETIPHITIQEAEEALRDELALVSEAKVANIDGLKRAADLVSRLDGAVSEKLLEQIDNMDEDLALAIKRSMFTFEDLLKVDNRDLQSLLKEISTEQLRYALKTSSPELRDHVLGAMSKRAAEMLMDDLDSMGPVRLSVVDEAQSAIVEVALQLQTDGKIQISGVGGEQMV